MMTPSSTQVRVAYPGTELTVEDYGDMIMEEQTNDDDIDEEMLDKYLGAELILGVGTNNERWGWVIKQSKGIDGNVIGRVHSNPLFDTHEYDIKFTDGSIEKYQANIIAENMDAQVDDKGHQFQIIEEIVDSAIPISEGMI